MPRIPNPDSADAYEKNIIKQMIQALQATTEDERMMQLKIWCEGKREWYRQFAQEKGIMPIALLLVSMVEISHPFICEDDETLKGSITWCMTEIIKAELYNTPVKIPLYEPEEVVHSEGEDVHVVHRLEEDD